MRSERWGLAEMSKHYPGKGLRVQCAACLGSFEPTRAVKLADGSWLCRKCFRKRKVKEVSTADYIAAWKRLEAALERYGENREIWPRELLATMESILRTVERRREPDTSRFLSWIVE